MEERRLLLAIVLSLLVLTAYQLLFPTAPRPNAPAPPTPPPKAVADTPGLPGARPSGPSPPAQAPAPPEPLVADHERRVEAQGADLSVAFTNRGARLISWRLENFKDSRGRPEEMVQSLRGGPRPLDLETGEAELDALLRDALFQASEEQISLGRDAPSELTFRFAQGDLEVEKAFRFPPRGYLISVRASVRRGGRELPKKILWGPGIGNPTAAEAEVQGYVAPGAVFFTSAGVERVAVGKIGPGRSVAPARWVGVESTHFAALFVPPEGAGAEIRAAEATAAEDGKVRIGPQALVRLDSGEAWAILYVGPKDHFVLSGLGHDLQRVVPVGEWIGPIVIPLMGLLRWVHGHLGNYGWSIVALTLLINVAMAPVRHYSIASGLKMAKLAPEMKVIQERYRKVPLLDPRRQDMQQEIAELYERHGLSMSTQMLVGCLPLLLTMPFLVAFYRVLQVAVELRGARFLWIPDLSQKDPVFLTPILMGASMWWMQRMMPTSMDPAQQKILLIMPIVLSGMFLWAPSGLNLYWLASNLCSIVQQGVTKRIIRAKEAAEEPQRERRRG